MKKENFWFGKNVLITGGNGFVASNLCLELFKKGANVVITLRHHDPLIILELIDKSVKDKPDVEFSDLSDIEEVRRICDRHQIDTIFHLAASAIVSNAAVSPVSTLKNNINTTINILEVARINKIPRVIVASSDKAYGDHSYPNDREKIPYREGYALRGLDIYSTSKVCTDMICQAYSLQYSLPVLITRCCNIYGPGDMNFTRLIPRTIMRLLLKKQPVINEGNKSVLREYCYIEDVVGAYMFLAENVENYYEKHIPSKGKDVYGWSGFNIGSYKDDELMHPDELPNIKNVDGMIKLICKLLNVPCNPKIIPKPKNFIEIPDQYNDSTKLKNLGFSCKVNLEKGIENTIKWYKTHQKLFKRIGYGYFI